MSKRIITFIIDNVIWVFGKVSYGLYKLFGWRFVGVTGAAIYGLRYLTDFKKRKIIHDEYSNLFGDRFSDRELTIIAKNSLLLYYKRQVETFYLAALDKDQICRILKVEGLEHIEEAIAKGKGVILLLSHIGSFLLPLPYFGFKGYKINQITGIPIHMSLIAERVWKWRKKEADRLPVKYVQTGNFIRSVFLSLKNNEIVVIAFDGRDGSKWREISFFNKQAYFSSGPFEIARKTGATIVPAFVIRESNNTHKLILEPLFKLSDATDKNAAAQNDTENFARKFAYYLERYPDHFGKILYNYRIQKIQKLANPFFNEADS